MPARPAAGYGRPVVTSGHLRPRCLAAADALVGIALAVFAAFRTPAAPALTWGVWVLCAVLALPLAARGRRPGPVLAVVVPAGGAAIIAGVGGDAVTLAVAYALYPVALATARRPAALALAAALAGVTAAGLAVAAVPGLPLVAARAGEESFAATPVSALAYSAVVITGSWGLARAVRARRDHAALLADLRARRAVAEERLRIARDVHDIVGHGLTLIAMKAAVANHLADSHPEEGRAALGTIERVSRGALDDVRAVLGALRDPADAVPGAAEFDRLVDDTRAAGVTVDVVRADLTGVPATVQVSAYRIAQEALTNVVRHAGATRCRLVLTAHPGALTVSVVDQGTAPRPAGPPGHGLLGMRERVALHGGTLEAGADPGGGFAVRARLPFAGRGGPP